MNKLRVGDEVIVTAGKEKSKTGTIKKIYWKQQRVLVDGLNMSKKAIRPSEQNPDGGIIEKENPLHISNVAIVSPKTNKATRVKIEMRDDKKVRVAKACGSVL